MLYKLIGEKKYTEDCFAYVPDKSNPDKWTLQIKEYDGDAVALNKDLLVEAAKAFEPDGTVQIHATDIMGVKTAIRAGFRSLNVTDTDIPGSVMESVGIDCIDDTFQEGAFKESAVDKGASIIRNVVFITSESKNNRHYTPNALDNIVQLAEGGKLFANHPTKSQDRDSGGVRDVREMIGKSINLRHVGEKVVGDAAILSNHAQWVMPIAEQMPELCGFSWTGGGTGHRQGGKEIVEAVSRHTSHDLVSSPGAVKNLFEQLDLNEEGIGEMSLKWNELTEALIKEKAPELYKKLVESKETGTMSKETEAKIDTMIKENTDLKTEVGNLKKESEVRASKSIVDLHLNKFQGDNKLDEALVEDLRTTLIGKTEDQIKEAVDQRGKMLIKTGALKLVKGMGAEYKQESQKEGENPISSKDMSRAVGA